MKIVLVHNHYQQAGGEDSVFNDEAALLVDHGHDVIRYTRHNDAIDGMSRIQTACNTLWNRRVYAEMRSLLRRERPDVMHCTNTFPLISPAVYYAAKAEGVPVVQSLHNFRLLCSNALFLRDGKVCEDCLGKFVGWAGIRHGCYRESRAASAVVAALQTVHRAAGTWTRYIDRYIALTEFARQKFIAGGLPGDKIAVKPNFVAPDPGIGAGRGGYAIYVGRLSVEKGIETLLGAWAGRPNAIPLTIVGNGPLAHLVEHACQSSANIQWLGQQSRAAVESLIADAAVLVLPSSCYEQFPKTIAEAFAAGTPVVASRFGSMAEIVDPYAGRLCTPGDSADLAAQVEQLVASPSGLATMRVAARREYETKYTAERNYEILTSVYDRVVTRPSTREVPEYALN